MKESDTFQVQVEISHGESNVKYEMQEGLLKVDRFIRCMPYPTNYGSILNTMGGDGDPVDAFVVTPYPLALGCAIDVRPICSIMTVDEKGDDLKVLCLPADALTNMYKNFQNLSDLRNSSWGSSLLEEIEYFLTHYKDLEGGKKKVSFIGKWQDYEPTLKLVKASFNF